MAQLPNWEFEIDTPATVAVIGGGAVGIEAALYARFLGYYVVLIETAKMAQSWRSGSHLPMLLPFGHAASSLGKAALEAHRPETQLPHDSDVLTGMEFAEKYLVPLARTDLLYECVHVHSRVMSVSRLETRRETMGDIQDRADIEYRLAIHSKSRGWFVERADIVLDCSGNEQPRPLGPGGGLAIGELEHGHLIDDGLPDVNGKSKHRYAGQRIALIGTSLAALQNLVALAQLVRDEPATRVSWLVPLDYGQVSVKDCLARTATLAEHARGLVNHEVVQQVANGEHPGIIVLPMLGIDRMHSSPKGLTLCIQENELNTLDLVCDRVINGGGHHPNWDHAQPLRVGQATELANQFQRSPMNVEQLLQVEVLSSILTEEPHYYILGSKSFGLGHEAFTLQFGMQQIRQVFAMIGGRQELDLYANIQR